MELPLSFSALCACLFSSSEPPVTILPSGLMSLPLGSFSWNPPPSRIHCHLCSFSLFLVPEIWSIRNAISDWAPPKRDNGTRILVQVVYLRGKWSQASLVNTFIHMTPLSQFLWGAVWPFSALLTTVHFTQPHCLWLSGYYGVLQAKITLEICFFSCIGLQVTWFSLNILVYKSLALLCKKKKKWFLCSHLYNKSLVFLSQYGPICSSSFGAFSQSDLPKAPLLAVQSHSELCWV